MENTSNPAEVRTIGAESSEDLEDAEVIASRENRRRWWRRAIVMTLAVLIGAPVTAMLIWSIHITLVKNQGTQISFPGPRDAQLRAAYLAYMQTDGYEHRGQKFSDCAGWLERRRFSSNPVITEQEVLFYLGPPDLISDLNTGSLSSFAYFYDRFAKKDWALFVTIEGASGMRQATQFGWTARSTIGYPGFRPYSPANAPSKTVPPNATR